MATTATKRATSQRIRAIFESVGPRDLAAPGEVSLFFMMKKMADRLIKSFSKTKRFYQEGQIADPFVGS